MLAHGRRKLFALTQIAKAPVAAEAVRRTDAIFDAERDINGVSAAERRAVRQQTVGPLMAVLEAWMQAERGKLLRHSDVARARNYMLKRGPAFTRFLDDGRICLTNAAERALRGIAVGCKARLFAGCDRVASGRQRSAR